MRWGLTARLTVSASVRMGDALARSPDSTWLLLQHSCQDRPTGPQLSRIDVATPGGDASFPLYVPGLDAWDGLGLEYRAEWPLQMMLTPQVN
jgi:hypothetical protein